VRKENDLAMLSIVHKEVIGQRMALSRGCTTGSITHPQKVYRSKLVGKSTLTRNAHLETVTTMKRNQLGGKRKC